MIHKRPFIDEDCFELPCKHPKQWDYTNHLTPMVHISGPDDHLEPHTSDDDSEHNKCQDQGTFMFEPIAEVSTGNDKDFDISSGSLSPFFWANDNFPEADVSHLSFFPEYFAPQHHLRALLQPDEIYSSLFNYHPLKPVSIGPEFQADVPEWRPQRSKNCSSHLDGSDHQVGLELLLDSGVVVADNDEEKLMGACVIPMPDSETSTSYCSESWVTSNRCECLDKGSIRCVRQHVMEGREKFRENLGQKIFEELGFHDMGEDVSTKWTEEEEKKFHEVVSSNRASMGKNFWDYLPMAFPSRTKNDLVSYYFNVFILQKRAEQNRFDPLNVDSDDDEWQRSDLGSAEEDEDSGLESLTDQEAHTYYKEDHGENCNHDPDGVNAIHTLTTNEEGDVDGALEMHLGNLLGDSGGDSDLQLWGNIQGSKQKDYDIQDDLCTSYEYQQEKVDCSALIMGTGKKQSNQE